MLKMWIEAGLIVPANHFVRAIPHVEASIFERKFGESCAAYCYEYDSKFGDRPGGNSCNPRRAQIPSTSSAS
jgi:hypothetical protein